MPIVAIHVIWTTYMTWPPGDQRGHWSPLFDLYGRLREEGHRLNLPDPVTLEHARELAKEPRKVLTEAEINKVAQVIGKMIHPGGGGDPITRGAKIYAAAIEPNHVHLLFAPLPNNLGSIIGRIKSKTSSAVLNDGGKDGRRTWTTGYWKVFLFDELGVVTVQRYVEAHNIRRGLAAAPFAWICPYSPHI